MDRSAPAVRDVLKAWVRNFCGHLGGFAFCAMVLLGAGNAPANTPHPPIGIQILRPASGSTFRYGNDILFRAAVSGVVNPSLRVLYFDNTNLIGTSAAPFFAVDWQNAAPGPHSIYAMLTLNQVILGTSAPVQVAVVPPNGSFAKATVLTGSNVTVLGSTMDTVSNLAWYSWRAPVNGRVILSVPDWTYGTYIGVYTGTTASNLTLVADDLAPDGSGWFTSFNFAVLARSNYFVMVTAGLVTIPSFTLKLEFHPPPANDNFENRALIPGHGGISLAYNLAATVQPGEPSAGYYDSGRTVWWTWTAPTNGQVTFQPEDNFETVLGIYRGTVLTNLVAVTQTLNSPATFNVVAGTTFQISIGGQFGEVRLQTSFTATPANDDFTHAAAASGVSTVIKGNNTAATHEPGEPTHAGVGNAGSVWYKWVAPVTGYVRLVPNHTSNAAVIAVYTGSVITNLTAVAGTNGGALGFEAVAGTIYHIAIDGIGGWEGPFDFALSESTLRLTKPVPGTGFHVGQPILISASGPSLTEWGTWAVEFLANGERLSIVASQNPVFTWTHAQLGYYTLTATTTDRNGFAEVTQPVNINVGPLNDDFSNAFVLRGLSISTNGDNFGAGMEPGEPTGGDPSANASVWYAWKAPASGAVAVSIGEDSFEGHSFGVYTGSSVSNLTALAENIYSFYQDSFVGLAGVTYYIEVSGAADDVPNGSGPFTLNLVQTPGPPNDFFANRILLSGTALQITGSNINATSEQGEPGTGASVWWSWTAPATGILSVTASGNRLGPVLTWFTGNTISNLQSVATLYPSWYYGTDTAGEVPVQGRTTYQIRLTGSYDWPEGTVTMNWSFATAPTNDSFAGRLPLNGPSVALTNLIGTATEEVGEPGYSPNGQSVWWTWTATNAAETMIIADGTCGAPTLDLYTGDSLAGLALVTNGVGTLLFTPTSGVTYMIEASQNSCGNTNAIVYLALQNGAPPNDSFAQRIQLFGSNVSVRGSTMLASGEAGEPTHGGYQGSNSVWWTWTAPANGTLGLNINGDEFTPTWEVYTGSALNNLSSVASSYAQPFGGISSSGLFPVTAGLVYQIAVDGYSAAAGGALGDFSLNLTFNGPPINDNFADSIPIAAPVATVTGVSVLASKEAGEPDHAGYEGGHSLWWSFTAPASGWLELNAQGSSPTTLVAVYTGDTLSNLVSVAAGNASFAPVEFYVSAGTNYKIATDYWYSDMSGVVVLNLLFETLQLTSPTNGADLYGTSPLTLTAEVTDWDGPFSEMDFLVDGTSIGAVTNPPYTLEWSNPTLGSHTLQVQLVDSNVVTRISPPNEIAIHPVNDNFADRMIITGSNVTFYAQGTGATIEPGEPAAGPIFYQSVWWTWTAPTSGLVTLSKADLNDRYAILAVYTGTTLTNLALATYTPENGSGTLTSKVTFEAEAGIAYQITFAGSIYEAADVPLTLSLSPSPSNQTMARAMRSDVIPSDQPSLSEPVRLSPAEFGFQLNGTTGSTYTILYSTNFASPISVWTPLLTTNLSGNSAFIRDTHATNSGRFYRVAPFR